MAAKDSDKPKSKGGRPKGSHGKLSARDWKAITLHLGGKPVAVAMAEAGFKAANSSHKWLARPEVKAELDRRRQEMSEVARQTGLDLVEETSRIASVAFVAAKYTRIVDGTPRPHFPKDMPEEDRWLKYFVKVTCRTVGRGEMQQTIEEWQWTISASDILNAIDKLAKLRGEYAAEKLEVSSAGSDDEIRSLREEVQRRKRGSRDAEGTVH